MQRQSDPGVCAPPALPTTTVASYPRFHHGAVYCGAVWLVADRTPTSAVMKHRCCARSTVLFVAVREDELDLRALLAAVEDAFPVDAVDVLGGELARVLDAGHVALLIANFSVTAAMSGWAAMTYFRVPEAHIAVATAGTILLVGGINYFGPKHSGSLAVSLAVPLLY